MLKRVPYSNMRNVEFTKMERELCLGMYPRRLRSGILVQATEVDQACQRLIVTDVLTASFAGTGVEFRYSTSASNVTRVPLSIGQNRRQVLLT
jgi:hypothetical protein